MKVEHLRHVDSDTLRRLADDDFDEHGVFERSALPCADADGAPSL